MQITARKKNKKKNKNKKQVIFEQWKDFESRRKTGEKTPNILKRRRCKKIGHPVKTCEKRFYNYTRVALSKKPH